MPKPKVSVIMNCYNSSKYLREAIDSVYAQTYRDWEIIFWDNASTDNSADIAKSYDENLRYFYAEKTVPLGYARNLAIEKAQGEYIAFLDCDDIWLPEKLEKQIELLKLNEDVALVYSDSSIIDGDGVLKQNTYLWTNQRFYRGLIFEKLLLADFIPLLTVVLRKNKLDKVGLFNTKYKIAEDYDLFLRVAESNKIDYIDQPLAMYRFHSFNASKNIELMTQEEFQLIDYWADKETDFPENVKKAIRKKKTLLYLRLIKYYFFKFEYTNLYRTGFNLLKFFYKCYL